MKNAMWNHEPSRKKQIFTRRAFLGGASAFGLTSLVAALSGCGSGGGSQSGALDNDKMVSFGGRATITLEWPARSAGRVIPTAANCVRVTIADTAQATKLSPQTVDLTRPDAAGTQPLVTTHTFTSLPVGYPLTVTATAFPNRDATGEAQAKASLTKTFAEGISETNALTLSLIQTVTKLILAPLGPVTLTVGQSADLPLSAIAQNGNKGDATVLIGPKTVVFTSSDETVATVSPATDAGNATKIHAVAPGAVKITATFTEIESGSPAVVAATLNVSVLPAPLLSFLKGRMAFQQEYKDSPDAQGGSDASKKYAFLREYDFSKTTGDPTRTLVDPADPRLYDARNPVYDSKGQWLVFYAITQSTDKRDLGVDHADVWVLNTKVAGSQPINLTKTLFPDRKCRDPKFAINDTKIVMTTQQGGNREIIQRLNFNASGPVPSATIDSAFVPLEGTNPLLLDDGSLYYTAYTEIAPSKVTRVALRTAAAPKLLPVTDAAYTVSYYVNYWKPNTLLFTEKRGDTGVDKLVSYTINPEQTTALTQINEVGKDNSDPARATDDLILFSRRNDLPYRMFVGKPNPMQAPEAIPIPNVPNDDAVLGASYTEK